MINPNITSDASIPYGSTPVYRAEVHQPSPTMQPALGGSGGYVFPVYPGSSGGNNGAVPGSDRMQQSPSVPPKPMELRPQPTAYPSQAPSSYPVPEQPPYPSAYPVDSPPASQPQNQPLDENMYLVNQFINDPQFYITHDMKTDGCSNAMNYDVRVADMYGQLDLNTVPVFSFSMFTTSHPMVSATINNKVYSLQSESSGWRRSRFLNLTMNQELCALKVNEGCNESTVTLMPNIPNCKPIVARYTASAEMPVMVVNTGVGNGTVVPYNADTCGQANAALVTPDIRPHPMIDPFTLRLFYIVMYLTLRCKHMYG